MGKAILILHALMCCMLLSFVGVCGFTNLTGVKKPFSVREQQSSPPPPFSVVSLESHKLSNGLVVDCVRLLPNSSSPLSEEVLSHQFPKSGSGWRKLTRSARAQFEAEVPQRCSAHMGSIAVQRGDIFDNITRRHIMTPSNLKHSYAVYSSVTEGFFTGAVAALSINKPSVQEGEVSISQIWVIVNQEDDDDYSTLEAGWIVHPEAFGDGDPRLFIYWTNDNYQQTGCFNLLCKGFVQTDRSSWTLGEKFPTGTSIPGNRDRQQYVLFAIFKDPGSGLWHLQLDTNVIGYWDPNILTNFQENSADELQFGGEVQLKELGSSTEMGSGFFPRRGFPWAASYSFIRYLHNSLDFNYFGADELGDFVTQPNFYGLSGLKLDSYRRVDKFFFGGSGD